jgi:uncharacterized protein (DUF2062 family)
VPGPLALGVLILASFRLWRLLGYDELTEGLRSRLTGSWHDGEEWQFDRPLLAQFVTCPWCLGAWVSLLVYGGWLLWPTASLYVLVPLAISAAVGLIAKLDAP